MLYLQHTSRICPENPKRNVRIEEDRSKIRDPMRGPLGIPDWPAQQELIQKALPPSLFAKQVAQTL
jgi:hypothetical protein